MNYWNEKNLKNWQTFATILSLIAIPTVLGVVGNNVQSSISSESIKKDYVALAVGILANQKSTEDTEVRNWAIDVLAKNSPVPFSASLREKIVAGNAPLAMFAWQKFPLPPESLMQEPRKLLLPYEKNLNENAKIAEENAKQLMAVQAWVIAENQKNLDHKSVNKLMIPQGAIPYGPIDPSNKQDVDKFFNK